MLNRKEGVLNKINKKKMDISISSIEQLIYMILNTQTRILEVNPYEIKNISGAG